MKPSNMFSDMTEEKFNQLEAAKNEYRRELQEQMQSAKMKIASEKKRKFQEELEEEQRILAEIKDLNQAVSPHKDNSKPKIPNLHSTGFR